MKILLVGGNGNISWHCSRKLIDEGHEVYELHRGITYASRRNVHPEAKIIKGDIRDVEGIRKSLEDHTFDVVCDFICYNDTHARNDIEVFSGKTKQFVFISSEVVYERNIRNLPFYEDCEKKKTEAASEYAAGKLLAEEVFLKAYRESGFPVTIVRPGYTYDTILPVSIGHNCWTAIDKILKGKPLLIAGEGSNIWNFTNSAEFADRFFAIIGNNDAIGEAFDISADEWLTWNDVSEILLNALGVDADNIFHIPYERALELSELQPRDMMRDRMWHNIRTNEKIKSYMKKEPRKISFEEGVRISLNWLNEAPEHKRIVPRISDILDKLYTEYGL